MADTESAEMCMFRVPGRYRALIIQIIERLPEGWDDLAVWSMRVGEDPPPGVYARVQPDEVTAADEVTSFTIEIFPSMMGLLSDEACRWVIAHEFAHIASGVRHASLVIRGKRYIRVTGETYREAPTTDGYENSAESIALAWGFGPEHKAWLTDNEKLAESPEIT